MSVNTTAVLYIHIIFAFIMFAGSFGATLLRYAAMKYHATPSHVAVILGIVRPVVPVVVIAMLLTILFGLWLASYEREHFHEAWLIATYILVAYILIVGAVAGKRDRLTRELAERLSSSSSSGQTNDNGAVPAATKASSVTTEGDSIEALKKSLDDPISWTLNLSMLGSIFVIIALMVFRPGAGDDDE